LLRLLVPRSREATLTGRPPRPSQRLEVAPVWRARGMEGAAKPAAG